MLLSFVVWGADPEIFLINRFSLSNFHLFIGLFIFILQPIINLVIRKDKKNFFSFEMIFMYALVAALISIISSAFIKTGTEIFGLGPISVRWYGLLFASGFLIGQQILFYIFRKDGKPEKDVEVITIYVVLATVIGARLGHVFFYDWPLYRDNPIDILKIWEGGLASHGATVTILFALWLYSRKKPGQSFFWIVDRIVITVALGGALIRVGNLMNSEIYGKATDAPYAFVYALPEGLKGTMKEFANQIYVDKNDGKPLGKINGDDVLLDVKAQKGSQIDFKYSNALYKSIEYQFYYNPKLIDSSNIIFITKGIIENVSKMRSESFRDNIYVNESKLSQKITKEGKAISISFNAFGKTRHPTQIYEALFCIFLLALTFWLWKYKRNVIPEGFISAVFIILLFTFRFFVEYLKKEQVEREKEMALNIGQQLSIPAVLFGIGILIYGFYMKNKIKNPVENQIIEENK